MTAAERRLKTLRLEAYREAILDAAEPVFAEGGYDETRVSEVADAAGVSVGTLYGVVGSKAELYAAVLSRRLPELLTVAREAALLGRSSLDHLERGIDGYLRYLLAHPDYLRIHLRAGGAWGLVPQGASDAQLAAWEAGLELEASLLALAMDDGYVIDEDPVRLARMIAAVHQVQLAHWVDGGMVEPVDAFARRLGRLFRTLFCRPGAP